MNTKKKWNIEDTCKLIELYRESTILWDASSPNYKNKFKKADALKVIAIQLNTDANEIDRKLKNVYSQYSRERRAYKAMKKSGAGREFRAKWFGYELMSFLQDKNKARKSREAGLTERRQEKIIFLNIYLYIIILLFLNNIFHFQLKVKYLHLIKYTYLNMKQIYIIILK